MKGSTTVTFDLDQTVADLRDLFSSEQYFADGDVAVARFTAERALRAYGCPTEIAETIAQMIYYAACNVTRQTLDYAIPGAPSLQRYDILAQARTRGVAA